MEFQLKNNLEKGILFSTLILSVLFMSFSTIQAQKTTKQPRILVITRSYYEKEYSYYLSRISLFGEIYIESITKVNTYTIDDWRQYDIFVASNKYYSVSLEKFWYEFPQVISRIGSMVEEGRSLLVHADGGSYHPASAWVTVKTSSTSAVMTNYDIISNEITQGVNNINGSGKKSFLYGGYPLVLSPKKMGYPDPQGALMVYGYYGKGKYAVYSNDLFTCTGDVERLFSNLMHWITDREIPPPLSVVEIGEKIEKFNASLNFLYKRMSQLNNSINFLLRQIDEIEEKMPSPSILTDQLKSISDELNELAREFNQSTKKVEDLESRARDIGTQVENLSNDISSLKSKISYTWWFPYVSAIAIVFSLITLTITLARGRIK